MLFTSLDVRNNTVYRKYREQTWNPLQFGTAHFSELYDFHVNNTITVFTLTFTFSDLTLL